MEQKLIPFFSLLLLLVGIASQKTAAQTKEKAEQAVAAKEAFETWQALEKGQFQACHPSESSFEQLFQEVEEIATTDTLFDHYNPDSAVVVSDALIKDRLSCIESEIPLRFSHLVRRYVDYFTIRKKGLTQRILERKDQYFPIYEKVLAEKGMPEELKYLSVIESALNPDAVSRSGAVGLWQFMPGTGRWLGLEQNYYIDQRKDPIKATKTAAGYLESLHEKFKDWELAMAAYNCGPGYVRRAIRRSGYKHNYQEIYPHIPRETRNYVPKFVALVYAMQYHEEHNIVPNPSSRLYIPYDTVRIDQQVDLRLLSQIINIDYTVLKTLNPELRRSLTPPGRSYSLKLPLESLHYFQQNRVAILDSAGKNKTKSVYYTVKRGNSLGHIASNFGVTVSQLKRWNGLTKSIIYPGQKLVIYKTSDRYNAAFHLARRQPHYANTSSSKKVYIVQPGDTLWNIARQHDGVSVERIMQINKLKTKTLHPGQKLIVG